MPTPGDVDLVVAAELMEGGRAIQRGLVTPDRSVLITSSHRSYAVSEKSAPGNGIADPNKVLEAGRAAAKRFMCFDLQDLADRAGSVISASLFGAVAGSGALPSRAMISKPPCAAPAWAWTPACAPSRWASTPPPRRPPSPRPSTLSRPCRPRRNRPPARTQPLLDMIRRDFACAQPMLTAGVRRQLEFQDLAYAREYLERMKALRDLDARHGGERGNGN